MRPDLDDEDAVGERRARCAIASCDRAGGCRLRRWRATSASGSSPRSSPSSPRKATRQRGSRICSSSRASRAAPSTSTSTTSRIACWRRSSSLPRPDDRRDRARPTASRPASSGPHQAFDALIRPDCRTGRGLADVLRRDLRCRPRGSCGDGPARSTPYLAESRRSARSARAVRRKCRQRSRWR